MISIDIIFKGVNFFIILFFFVALFKQYIAPFFIEEKKRYDIDIKNKKISRALLEEKSNQLAIEGKNQLLQEKYLESKCKLWALQIQKNHEQQEKNRTEIQANMVDHRQKQSIFVQQQRCLQQQLPVIFAEVEKSFKGSHDKETVSEKYCEAILTFMKEQ